MQLCGCDQVGVVFTYHIELIYAAQWVSTTLTGSALKGQSSPPGSGERRMIGPETVWIPGPI